MTGVESPGDALRGISSFLPRRWRPNASRRRGFSRLENRQRRYCQVNGLFLRGGPGSYWGQYRLQGVDGDFSAGCGSVCVWSISCLPSPRLNRSIYEQIEFNQVRTRCEGVIKGGIAKGSCRRRRLCRAGDFWGCCNFAVQARILKARLSAHRKPVPIFARCFCI